jgi:hypothetical protein
MQFWWAPQNTPPERIAYLQNLLAEAMATREIKESFQNLHMDPVLQVGQDLLKTIADRSQKLQGITIDKPTALPPLESIILGITVICFVFVLRESKSA